MKRWIIPAGCAAMFAALSLHAQTAPKSSATATMESMKAANAVILEQQARTLIELEEMLKTAQQIRIFAKRS